MIHVGTFYASARRHINRFICSSGWGLGLGPEESPVPTEDLRSNVATIDRIRSIRVTPMPPE